MKITITIDTERDYPLPHELLPYYSVGPRESHWDANAPTSDERRELYAEFVKLAQAAKAKDMNTQPPETTPVRA